MDTSPPLVNVSKSDLFFTFLVMGLTSFGGVMPLAHRLLIDKKRWLSSQEFAEALSIGQILPGPNIVNLSVMVGARFQGAIGSVLAFSGLMLAPLTIILLLAMFYSKYGQLSEIQHAFHGTAAASAGLVIAMGLKLLIKLKRVWSLLGITLCAFIGSGILALPLLTVIAVLAPISIGLAWINKKKEFLS
ncbi:MAG: chromate transporter [Pseudomonadota bacterium]